MVDQISVSDPVAQELLAMWQQLGEMAQRLTDDEKKLGQ